MKTTFHNEIGSVVGCSRERLGDVQSLARHSSFAMMQRNIKGSEDACWRAVG